MGIFDWVVFLIGLIALVEILLFGLPIILVFFSKEQDLKSKYDCKWALVTGGSSGIGLSIVRKLYHQNINVVLVCRDQEHYSSIKDEFSEDRVRVILTDLRKGESSVNEIIEQTKDLYINIVFNNAGYMSLEGFHQTSIKEKIEEMECNSLSSFRLTDHFYRLMVHRPQGSSRGAIIFTSSSVGPLPTPYSTTYATSKLFLSGIAKGLATESRAYGIDILAVQPGAVNESNFFKYIPNHLGIRLLSNVYSYIDIR
eukprot:gene5549-6910_t